MARDNTNGDGEANDNAPEAQAAAAAPEEAREAELKDKLLRALAETENLRRRAEREKEDALQYGITRFARDLLTVVDSLQRALSSVSEDARASASEPVKNLIAGIELTEKELLRVLERYNIKRIAAKGEVFNPHLHQAMAQVPDALKPEGTVIEVAQTGYTIGERLLRPAMVVITKKPDGSVSPGGSVDTRA
jgi:molecular chaperone GrpE